MYTRLFDTNQDTGWETNNNCKYIPNPRKTMYLLPFQKEIKEKSQLYLVGEILYGIKEVM